MTLNTQEARKHLVKLLGQIDRATRIIENLIIDDENDKNYEEHILNVLGKEASRVYPFHLSFDEFRAELGDFIDAVQDEIEDEDLIVDLMTKEVLGNWE